MVQTPIQTLTLEEFLQLPETEPASDFINGEIIQKPMPQGEHSVLQGDLISAVNDIGKPSKTFYALPELRCTFGGATVVPDVSVFRWQRIPLQPSGRIMNHFKIHPDWAIEILSPDQSQTKVLNKLLHCSQHGTELGWLLFPEDEGILVVLPESRVKLYQGTEVLPVLEGLDLVLTPERIFGWLSFQ
jgi:Uma2 family endonuclease